MKPTTLFQRRSLLAALVLGLICPQLYAVDFHATTAQGLQNALTQAANNSTNNNIYLASGHYVGNFKYNSSQTNNLTLLPEAGLTNTAVTIDGGGVGSGLIISSSTSLNTITVQGLGFAINSGSESGPAALQIGAGSQATILVNGCILFGTNSGGNGLNLVSGGNATINGCTVVATAVNTVGNAVMLGNFTGNISVQNCSLSGAGLAVYADGSYVSSIAVSDNIFTGNSSCLYIGGDDEIIGGTLNVSSNIFNGNSIGGGVGVYLALSWFLSAVTFNGNTFATNGAAMMFFGNTDVVLTGNMFKGNSLTGDKSYGPYYSGGGVNVQDWQIGDGSILSATQVMISGNDFIGNSNSVGTVYAKVSQAVVTVQANTFEQNISSGAGGALYVSAPTVTIADKLVVGNTQTNVSSTGGGVWVNAATNLYFINNTITGNVSAGGGGGAAFKLAGTVEVLNVYNNIILGNSGSPGADVWLSGTGEERVFSNNDAHDLFGIWDLFENNLDVDPQFVAPASGNYHLQKSSPCLNAGATAAPSLPAVDLDGNQRIVGGTVDLGCYELSAPVPLMVSLSLPSTGGVKLQWPSTMGANYIVQQSTDLRQGFHNWTGALLATAPVNTYSDTFQPGATTVFYRIVVQ